MMLVSRELCICIFLHERGGSYETLPGWWFEEIDVNMQDMSKLV